MPPLSKLQQTFKEAIVAPVPSTSLDQWVASNHKQARVNIYRKQYVLSLIGVLKEFYPVIHQLLGENCFCALGRDYSQQFPPRQAMLHDWAKTFPSFIKTVAPLAAYPYLADMAQLELAIFEASQGGWEAPINVDTLLSLPDEEKQKLRFSFCPTLHHLTSVYDIKTLWEAHQETQEPSQGLDFSAGEAKNLLIYRASEGVVLKAVSPSLSTFIRFLWGGASLEQAWEPLATTHDPEDLVTFLQFIFNHQLIISFKENTP